MTLSFSKRYALLLVLLLWALIAQGLFSGFLIREQAKSSNSGFLPMGFREFSTVVLYVVPEYEDSGIKPGDEVIAINGEKISGTIQLSAFRYRIHPGDTLRVTVNRDAGGKIQTLEIPLLIKPSQTKALGWTYIVGLFLALPAACLLVGFYVAFARPGDPLAWITLAMLASFTQLVGTPFSWSIGSPWRELTLIYRSLLSNTWPLWMVLFAFYFPAPLPFLKRRRWVVPAFCFVPALLLALDLYGTLMQGSHIAELKWLYKLEMAASRPVFILYFSYVAVFFASLGYKGATLKAPDAKRRLRMMQFGCAVSLTPIIPIVLGEFGFMPKANPWVAVFCLLMLVLFPLTVGYVIVVQRAMDVRMVVRSGLQYALARTGILILRILLIVTVATLTVRFMQGSEHRIEGVGILAAGIGTSILLSRLARWVKGWIDRRFFREALNAERILTELSSSVAGIRDIKRLMETVSNRIADSMHVPRVTFLLERGGLFQPAYALGFSGSVPSVQLGNEAATLRTLRRLNGPSKVYFDDPQSWVHGTSQPEQTALRTLQTQVLLPVSLDSKMLGIISLGSKRSELPYTKADLQLLGAVAAQTGLALENAHLTESIRREVASRERLDRELEIARDVQQRLFPQKLPQVVGLDFAGYCRPALGVGGDYYDFIHLASGSLGIAVGDVSGKGIAAALMMASLQASLRGQTIKPCDTLSEMIQHINGLVYEASAANRYATFFYAQYEPGTRRLRYVNAGHNAPMVRRKKSDGHEFLRLEDGGTVIGLFPDFPYKEGEIALQAGDILVAFTDGISEAMNHADEEFDEARLMEAIGSCPDRSAAFISNHILERVDAFTAGAPQHDDMTIVVVRCLT